MEKPPSPRHKAVILQLFLLLFLIVLPSTSQALIDKPDPHVNWHISAERGTHDYEKGLYIADGDVIIKGGTTRLEADHVEFNRLTNDARARGHVLLISGEDTVTCEALDINLATEIGTIYDGTIFIQENNFYIRGEKIEKTGRDKFLAEQASLTSCDTDRPDWQITARNVRVTVGGYGVAKHATLYAGKIPTLYTPIMGFPAKTKRQTGLLLPEYSLSDRKGLELNLPLFLAINRASDATIYADYMEKRGVKLGVEYRYILDNKSRGTVLFDYLDDQKIDDGTSATEDFSYTATPQRSNTDRYWFRLKHNQALATGWQAKLDLDIVSDADYLHEFKDGYTGFTGSHEAFIKNFGRGLDDFDDTTRANRLNLNRTWDAYSLNMNVDWYDNVIARRLNQDDTTLQTLPSFTFTTVRQQINESNIYYDLEAGYNNFFRKDTTDSLVNGQKSEIYPAIYYPMRAGKFLDIEPSIGLRQTAWYSDEYTLNQATNEGFSHRELVKLNLDVSTRFSRVFTPPPGNRFCEKIKHDLIPALEYSYIPDVNQDDLPFFNNQDRIARQNQVTWSVTNRFTSKKIKPAPTESPPGAAKIDAPPEKNTVQTTSSDYVYHEFARVKLFQTYYLDDLTLYEDEVRKDFNESFSDISLEGEFSPFTWLSLEMDADWSPRDNQFMQYNTGFTLKGSKKNSLQLMHRYKRERFEPVKQDPSETIYARLSATITPRLNAFLIHENDLFNRDKIETATGVEYHKQCWSLVLAYRDKPDDRSIGFIINLYGIGEFGEK
jgi:LPS-assembly protein